MIAFNFEKSTWNLEDKRNSNKLDYSKRSIKEFLIKEFQLTGYKSNFLSLDMILCYNKYRFVSQK